MELNTIKALSPFWWIQSVFFMINSPNKSFSLKTVIILCTALQDKKSQNSKTKANTLSALQEFIIFTTTKQVLSQKLQFNKETSKPKKILNFAFYRYESKLGKSKRY